MEIKIEQTNSKLSNEYNVTFFQMLESFQNHLRNVSEKYLENSYSFLYPSFGNKFLDERKILFYGQCINGQWEPTFNIKETIDKSIVEQGCEFSNTCNPGEANTLDWVNKHWSDYAMYRSFFWNVAYKVTNKIIGIKDYKNSEEWSKYMAWSNLMKIGNIAGGNPNQDEYDGQIKFAVKLFRMELEEIKPEIAILLSGMDFSEDFTHELGLEPNTEGKEFIIIASKFNQTKVILTKRPKVGNNEKCVEEIIEAINYITN
jgi:hypothetical protein